MLTNIRGIKVGNFTDARAVTGCTVILCPPGTVGGVDVRGGAPGTRETDLLGPMRLVSEVTAVLLTGGSAFGLAAADGVMRYLEENGIGYDTGFAKVPIVPAAVIFDLNLGDSKVRPDAKAGYEACSNASGKITEGNVGAGTGATIGKIMGPESWMKGGLGTSSISLPSGVTVGALAVVNAIGDVFTEDGKILAGARAPTGGFLNTAEAMKFAPPPEGFKENTTLVVVATDANLNKEEVNKVAQMAHDGLARAISPVHTMYDGDTVFSLATGEKKTEVAVVGVAAAEAASEAIRRAVKEARPLKGVPALSSL